MTYLALQRNFLHCFAWSIIWYNQLKFICTGLNDYQVWSEVVDMNVMDTERAQNDLNIHSLHFPANMLHTRVCNFCKGDIFNRGYRCLKCVENIHEYRNLQKLFDFMPHNASDGLRSCDQCGSSACTNGVDTCLDCVAEGRGCGLHRGDMLLVQHFSEQYCRGICDSGIEAYRYMLNCLGYTAEMIEEAITQCRAGSLDLVSPSTIAFNQVVFTKEGQKSTCHQCKFTRHRGRVAFCQASNSKQYSPPPLPIFFTLLIKYSGKEEKVRSAPKSIARHACKINTDMRMSCAW